MKYGIKYIQKNKWIGGTKTERGWEGWDTNALYTDINAAYQAMKEPYGGWYYVVEEVEE